MFRGVLDTAWEILLDALGSKTMGVGVLIASMSLILKLK
jgi:hypothetical protein